MKLKFKLVPVLLSIGFLAMLLNYSGSPGWAVPLAPLEPTGSIQFLGDIQASEDISAIGQIQSFLVIGADEAVGKKEDKNIVQVLAPLGDDRYQVDHDILLFKGDEKQGLEMDIEGIAIEDQTIYVIGSHSTKRKRVKPEKSYQKNRKTFQDKAISEESNRDWLYRLQVDAQVQLLDKDRVSLRSLLDNHDVLKTFHHIPSKENGVDIEGIAAAGDWLYLGFRGPIFRENYVPILKLKFDDPQDSADLLFVNLQGRGIRDLTKVTGGFLIVAGPMGDGPGSYQLYFWNGEDSIPGSDRVLEPPNPVTLLGEIAPPHQSKAEGIVVLAETECTYDLILVYDGGERGIPQQFHVPKVSCS